jgi:hypothetical protein
MHPLSISERVITGGECAESPFLSRKVSGRSPDEYRQK